MEKHIGKQSEVELKDIGKELFIKTKKRVINYKKGEFFVVNQEEIKKIIQDKKKYTGETLRLLLFFMSIVEYDNRIKGYTQTQIAEIMGVKQPQISRAMKELESSGIIVKEGKDYYFNSNFLTKGQWSTHE